MANIMDLSTEDKLEYHFFPVSSGSVQFKVRTPNDAHIALTMGPQESDPMIEVFLGGWGNTKSVIRRNRTKPEKVEIETPNILNGGEFRGFWIRWDSGIISAGREGEAIPFLSWADPEPFPIAFVGVCTGWGATGTWKIEVSPVTLEPVPRKTFNERLEWRPMVDGKLPQDAMIGGFENEHIYIARAYHDGSLCPGKYVKSAGKAFVPWGGSEHCKEVFEILCGFNAKWVKTSSNYIPHNAIIGGRTGGYERNDEPLYIARAKIGGSILCGKAYARYNLAYLPYKGKEIEMPSYEILVAPDDEIPQALPFTSNSSVRTYTRSNITVTMAPRCQYRI